MPTSIAGCLATVGSAILLGILGGAVGTYQLTHDTSRAVTWNAERIHKNDARIQSLEASYHGQVAELAAIRESLRNMRETLKRIEGKLP